MRGAFAADRPPGVGLADEGARTRPSAGALPGPAGGGLSDGDGLTPGGEGARTGGGAGGRTGGTVTVGTLTVGTVTVGTLTVGTLTVGTLTVGTLTVGTLTVGTLTVGTLTDGMLTVVRPTPAPALEAATAKSMGTDAAAASTMATRMPTGRRDLLAVGLSTPASLTFGPPSCPWKRRETQLQH